VILLFDELREINEKPEPFQYYTAGDLWTDEHTSKKMLEYHLNESIDVSSRNARFIDRSVTWITDHFRLNSGAEVVDFGCGPGLYANRLASKNIKVTGIDFSRRSIDYARQQALTNHLPTDFIHKNYLEFESKGQFDLITMIMCDFCALSPAQRKNMLGKFRGLLKPDGKVLLDVYSLNAFDQKQEMSAYELNQMNNFWSPDDYYSFINTFRYDDAKVTLDKYTIVEKDRKRVVYNWLQYFSVESLKKEFEENGLIVEEVYSDVAGRGYKPESLEFAVVAKKG
jgi:2-polyprenyl-3-methyl-5-hydroxy-6-metoxy-1,4-benzoquinol methylase